MKRQLSWRLVCRQTAKTVPLQKCFSSIKKCNAAVNTLTMGHMTTYNVKVVTCTDTATEKFPLVLLFPLGIFGFSPSSLIGV